MEFRKRTEAPQPEVVHFDNSVVEQRKRNVGGSKHEWKKFMSSKIAKVNDESSQTFTPKEKKDEEVNDKLDVELQKLLNDSNILNRVVGESLVGKERHNFNVGKVVELGAKASKPARMPRVMRYMVEKNRKARAERELEDARNVGMLTEASRRMIEAKHKVVRKEKKEKRKDKGLRNNAGRFQDGKMIVYRRLLEANGAIGKKKSVRK
ncbi:hypothetical protein IWQ62_000140 [Dispira parvispora]|uniref:Uncharacterized protein n=1 Tax=Dispira parvispora TaxID=1520584 RepID=A0A9W8E9J5_9FUNG|nr:hypothetical protein IWQ62_000140 [Dispira parvispora]